MRFIVCMILLGLSTLAVSADSKLSYIDSDLDYILSCKKLKNCWDIAPEINERVVKYINISKYILKWRGHNFEYPDEQQDYLELEERLIKSLGFINILANQYCEFSELYPGGKVATGSHAKNVSECKSEYRIVRGNELLDKLEKNYLYKQGIKPSFNCAIASTSVELEICRSNKLSQYDLYLSEAYSKLPLNGWTKEAHRSWLKETRNSCGSSEVKKECLEAVMFKQLQEYGTY
ncbi:hypothetical protein [Marinagarivorans algicola]|uniref:hypothetical protein n=1 Tax=Marinagarivorans algicola TaxID=1513270 RepID=UPI0006B96F95|nr:hypothetical protein [Marinagarivorans algicola]